MEKQMPGEKNVPSNEEQLKFLTEKLAGNKAFKACRGSIYLNPINVVKNSKNPSNFCAKWDSLTAERKVMGNLLAKFIRDGWSYATELLEEALRNSSFLLPGEIFPIEETVPYTLVMPFPEKTLTLINWLIGIHRYEMYRYAKLNPYYSELKNFPYHSSNLTAKLFNFFPLLKDNTKKVLRSASCEGWSITITYQKELLEQFPLLENFNFRNLKGRRLRIINELCYLDVFNLYPIFIFPCNTKETLKHFTRKQQGNMTTWSFDIPKIITANGLTVAGMHEKNQHSYWKKKFPANASLNTSLGYGALIFPNIHFFPRKYKMKNQNASDYKKSLDEPIPTRFILES